MDEATRTRLEALDRDFYRRFGAAFDATRTAPWPGWRRALVAPVGRVLDLGCGNGRLWPFLAAHAPPEAYLGLDRDAGLLAAAAARYPAAELRQVDVLHEPWPPFSPDTICGFGLLHHVPSFEARRALLARAVQALPIGGRLVVTFWQLAPGGVPRIRTAPWSRAGVDPAKVEPGDHLVQWRRDGHGLRFAHHVDADEADRLLAGLPVAETDRFTADGQPGDLNLYIVATRIDLRT